MDMKKLFSRGYVVLLIFLFFLLFLSMIYSFSFLRKITVFNNLKHDAPVGEIYGDNKVGQTFSADYDGLSGIEPLLATYNRKNTGKFLFHLKQGGTDAKDISSYPVDIREVKDNSYFHLSFPKIEDSKGKTYYFYLEAPQSRPGNAITIWYHTSDSYKNGEKILNGIPSQGDLAFKTAYRPGLVKGLSTFLEKLTQNKPSPLNKRALYLVLMVLFVLSGSLLMTFLIKYLVKD
jgi:hypothetical protein